MQFAPPEDFPNALQRSTSQNTPLTEQHGLFASSDDTSDSRHDLRLVRELSSNTDVADTASVASSATSRGRRPDSRRMNDGRDSQESSPGSRIDAYEKAFIVPRRPSDGVVFQVIPSSGSPGTGVSLNDLPNGMDPVRFCVSLLIRCRGSYSRLVSPTTRVSVSYEPDQQPFSPSCNYTSSMANCFRKILPRCRIYRITAFKIR